VFLEKCIIANFNTGILMVALSPATHLFVTDSEISNNTGMSLIGSGGIAFYAPVLIDRSRMERNITAFTLDANSSAGLSVHLRRSVVAGSGLGMLAVVNTDGKAFMSDTSSFILNSTAITPLAVNDFVLLGRSEVTSNAVGIAVPFLGGSLDGHVLSYQNNHLSGNATDGAPTGVLTMK
jgi:hypothetical protein